MRRVVFLDRDGTLNEERGYLRDVRDLVLLPGAARAVRRLNDADVAAVLVTNQTGAARGYFPLAHIDALHGRLAASLAAEGARLDGVFVCPHLPAAEGGTGPLAMDCDCRKPAPGLALRAARELGLDLGRAAVVGDKSADVGLARSIGARAVLVRTGFGHATLAGGASPDVVADDVGDAVDRLLS